jgi:hypothetical protein
MAGVVTMPAIAQLLPAHSIPSDSTTHNVMVSLVVLQIWMSAGGKALGTWGE